MKGTVLAMKYAAITKKLSSLITALAIMLSVVPAVSARNTSDSEPLGRTSLASLSRGEVLCELYDRFDEAMSSRASSFQTDPSLNITEDELNSAYITYINDRPEHFWRSNYYSYYRNDSGSVKSVVLHYTSSEEDTREMQESFETESAWLLRGITEDMSEYDRTLLLHDRLAEHITYDLNAPHAHDAYGAIVNGAAVCEGYARAYQYLLRRVGIESTVVTGKSSVPGSSKTVSHAWNLVRIDGRYYYTDVTWDDQDSELYYAYFNVTRDMIGEDHIFDELPYSLPDADSYEANYYSRNPGLMSAAGNMDTVLSLMKQNGTARVFVTGSDHANIWKWFSENCTDIANGLDITGAFSYGYANLGREYHLRLAGTAEHRITVSDGTASADSERMGARITVTAAKPKDGYRFDRWIVTGGDITLADPYIPRTSFTLKNSDVSLRAEYTRIPTPPAITEQPQDAGTICGGSAKFSVKASGDDLAYRWYAVGGSFGGTPSLVYDGGATYTYSDAVRTDDGARIYCVVSNEYGQAVSGEAVLSVNHGFGDLIPYGDGHARLCVCGETADNGAHLDRDGDSLCDICGGTVIGEHFTVDFKPGEGTGSMNSIKAGASAAVLLPLCTFTPPVGKRFAAWSDGAARLLPGDTVTVTDNLTLTALWEVAATGIRIDRTELTFTESGVSEQLIAEVLPSDAAVRKVTWRSDDTSVATVSENGTVTAVGNGETRIIATSADGGFEAVCRVSVSIDEDDPTDITKIFRDVKRDWAYDGIEYCVRNGLMNGTSPDIFDPDGITTRAQVVTILWRLSGSPAPSGASPFTDLTQAWYRDAVAWASESGVVLGTSADTFEPSAQITREQMATILRRYTESILGGDVSASADITGYPDYESVSSYARKAMSWANASNLIRGTTNGGSLILDPRGGATRAQSATLLARFCRAFTESHRSGAPRDGMPELFR